MSTLGAENAPPEHGSRSVISKARPCRFFLGGLGGDFLGLKALIRALRGERALWSEL